MLQQPSMKSTGVNGISKKNQIKNLSPFCSRPGEYKIMLNLNSEPREPGRVVVRTGFHPQTLSGPRYPRDSTGHFVLCKS